MTQLGFYHNNDVCMGCKVCVVACKDKNDLPLGEKFRRVYDYGGGTWDVTSDNVCTPKDWFTYSVSVACMHCASPACKAVCPVGAIRKRSDGVVWIDADVCIGCGACGGAGNAENNGAVGGKREVLRDHDMHWLRIDRYFISDETDPDHLQGVVFQPMLCQH